MARTPFYGRGPGPAIARMDMNAATAPGRAYGQMYANMGKQVGDTIKEYGLNKAKRAKLTGEIEAYYDQNKDALAQIGMSGDEAQDKKDFLQRDKFVKGDMSVADLEGYAGKLARGDVLKTQILNRKTQEQALGLAKQLEASTVEIAKLKAEIAGKTKDSVISDADAVARAKTSQANMSEVNEAYQKTDKALGRENIQSLIDYRKAASLSMLLKQNNINAPVPKDSEKRFSEIATLLGKNDDSTVKVRTSGIFGGDEVEISYSDYKKNPDEYTPEVNDRIKVLQANEERLRKEQTRVMQGFKIPVTDKETGEQVFITLLQKLEYDEKRKQLQEQKDSNRQISPDQRSGYMSGMNMDYSNLDPSVAELMATQP